MADQRITLELQTKAELSGLKAAVAGLNQFKAGIESFGQRLLSVGKLVAGFAAPLAGVVSTGAVLRFTKQAIDGADAAGKAAARAGQAVAEFSALAHAASLADVSQEGLSRASKELSEWLLRTGQSGKNLTDAFIEQADAVSKMSDGAEKLRLVNERFGKSGQELIPLLNQGSEALRQQMLEARVLGVVIGPEFTQRAQDFNDNLTRIHTATHGLFLKFADAILPELNKLSDAVVKWIQGHAERIQQFVTDSVHVLVAAYEQSRLGELLSLIVQAGLEEGFRLGVGSTKAVLSFAFGQFFSGEFLILCAQAGRALAEGLLNGVKVLVDALTSGFEFVFSRAYNMWAELNIKSVAFFLRKFTEGINAIIKASPALMLTVKPLSFDERKFKKDLLEGQTDTRSFGDIYAANQGQSTGAVDSILKFFDNRIAKTREILALGEDEQAQLDKSLTAYERLKALFGELARSFPAPEMNLPPPPGGGSGGIGISKEQAEAALEILNRQKEIEELTIAQLHTRGLLLEQSGHVVGSLQEESNAIKSSLEHMRDFLKAREELQRSLEKSPDPEAQNLGQKLELENAQERLRIEQQILVLKEKTNDFTFLEKFKRGLDDIVEQFQHVGAAIADVLTGGIRSAIDTVSNGIWQVIDGTATWGDLFRQVGREIISGLIRIAIQELFLDNLKRGIMFTWKALTSAFRAADLAEHTATETAKTPTLAVNATLSSIESWGIAAAVGVAAIAAVMASIGAFEAGGVVRGGRQLIQVNEAGTESVLNARATALLGEGLINDLNAGRLQKRDLEGEIAAGLAIPQDARNVAAESAMLRAGGNQTAAQQQAQFNGSFMIVDSRHSQAAKDYIASSAGRAQIIDLVRNSKMEIGVRS